MNVFSGRSRLTSFFDTLHLRDFRLLWLGESVSLLGDQFYFVALTWLTLQITGSGLALGTVLMLAAIPRAALMLIGGAVTDRVSPRPIMFISNAVRAVLVAALTALIIVHGVQDRKSTRLNSSHTDISRMPSSA